MSAEPLDALLEKLGSGDAAAAEQVFLTYEPYLRMVVRRLLPDQLRAKFDSVDIVQSVWADLLGRFRGAGWRFTDAAHLRAFLVKVTRNRFLARLRHPQTALRHEQALAARERICPGVSRPEQPGEITRAKELWEQMLVHCPPAHHELLRLRREGVPLDEIAARTGLHKSSVRRI